MFERNKSGMWRSLILTAGAVVFLVATAASGQTLPEPASPGDTAPSNAPLTQPAGAPPLTTVPAPTLPTFVNLSGFSNDYLVGTGDLLNIQVVGHTELNHVLRITNSGEISYPMVGLIPVVDMTVFEVETAIADRLQAKGLLKQPEVLVSVTEYQAKPIYVSGAVVSPGQFVMSQDLTVMDAILLAGGLQFNSSNEGLVHRRTGEGVEIIKVDLTPLKEGRFLESALPLQRGDVLVVPDQLMRAFFVVGDVVDPRNFFFPPKRTLTASQAISWAGGPTQTAKMSEGMLVRYDKNGERQEIKVDYAAILRGKQADFPIEPNDIIFIPGSKVKTIGQGLIGLTDSMVMQAAFRIGRTYQLPDASDAPGRQLRSGATAK
jgi:polysaccharide biosynthesis/export protein